MRRRWVWYAVIIEEIINVYRILTEKLERKFRELFPAFCFFFFVWLNLPTLKTEASFV
jgi:hypothetical protein